MSRRKKQAPEQVLYDIHAHNVNLNLRDLYVHSYYSKDDETSEEPGIDYRQATTFIKNLHVMDQEPNDPILVHMHSVGGEWDQGMAMFNAVQFCDSYVTILAYAQASSMSGIFLQSAPLRILMPDCHFMLHYGSTGYEGHTLAVMSMAAFNDKVNKRMVQIFAERCIKGEFFARKKSSTVETVGRYLDKTMKEKVDWYLDAEEAVFYGFADHILGCEEYPNLDSLREDE